MDGDIFVEKQMGLGFEMINKWIVFGNILIMVGIECVNNVGN